MDSSSVEHIPISDLREVLESCIENGNLFSVADIKILTRRFLRQLVADSKKDFAQLLFLDEYRRTIAVYKPYQQTPLLEQYAATMAADAWPEIQVLNEELSTAKEKYNQALHNAHLALIRLYDRAAHLRAQRLELAQCIISELEEAGENTEGLFTQND
ncbi:hypothetical protein P9112_011307 [Eukaryota sp. TZLM1-RC]